MRERDATDQRILTELRSNARVSHAQLGEIVSRQRQPLRIDDEECRRLASVREIVGKLWSSGILLALGMGAERYTEIERRVEGLSGRMLTVRLRELEEAGLVDRTVEPTTPVSVRYRLSGRGTELLRSLQPMAHYVRRWEPPTGEARPR